MIMLIAPFLLVGLSALNWALFFSSPTPFTLAMAIVVTGCFFVTLVTYNRWGR